MPASVEVVKEDEEEAEMQILVQSANTTSECSQNPEVATGKRKAAINLAKAKIPATGVPPQEFYAQLVETMKNLKAPQQPSKIVVESWDHEETVDLAKPQMSMLQLMYAEGEIDWDDGTIRSVCPTNFSAGFKNLQGCLATAQAAQLSNLFTTITIEPEDDDDDTPFNSLNSLMSLVLFPPKFTKAHLNPSFQSANIKTSSIYKSTNQSIPICLSNQLFACGGRHQRNG
jgi:hypothetical protein